VEQNWFRFLEIQKTKENAMKTLRFLLVLGFMLSLFVSPAQAKGGDEFGFVPLLTQVDPAIPLRVQAQQAFERLLPELLAAQQSGAILVFEPEFGAGIVKIKYAAGARADMLGGMPVLDNIHAAAALVSLTQPAEVPNEDMNTQAPYNPHIYASLYDSCFSINGLGDSDRVVGRLRDKTLQVVSVSDGIANASGYLLDCFSWTGPYADVLPGYYLTFKVYTSAGVLRGTYTSSAPSITFTAIDKVNTIVSGKGPAGKVYRIGWIHLNLDAGNTHYWPNRDGIISGAGTWSANFSGLKKFRGADYLGINVDYKARFTFYLGMTIPYAYCGLGGNRCNIYGFPFQAASMTITHASLSHTFTGKFSFWGGFGAELVDGAGYPIFLVAGDKVSGTGIPVYTLPNLSAAINYTTDVVSGKAPAGRYFNVGVYKVSSGASYGVWLHTDASGNYSANFHSMVDLKPADALVAEVSYRDRLTGNGTDLYKPFSP
jgi:hypothetical protein